METNQTVPTKEEIPGIIDNFYSDYAYDCHSISARYNRSPAARKLVLCGKPSLTHIAKLIADKFPNLETAGRDDVNWNLFAYIAWLIADIRDEHRLPAGPYASNTAFGQQDMKKLHQYCLENGE